MGASGVTTPSPHPWVNPSGPCPTGVLTSGESRVGHHTAIQSQIAVWDPQTCSRGEPFLCSLIVGKDLPGAWYAPRVPLGRGGENFPTSAVIVEELSLSVSARPPAETD
eukprot:CAMPEP_0173433992 /NCGR_PEP_ID=MMETSP1357-20121228/11224_1 /TAXON_ID=77926 /ORGANISM="Hemiselmis rufescens, Strain PCC563" /LENGTH=108 /DNA_ID=CAMNT_0014398747 /DNA_START=65 /DNA_END=391 /DNA_ORIENTATION=+